ncbi:fungal-specific transcription factor domain-containing protein, partial [Macrophomina phaseolina]
LPQDSLLLDLLHVFFHQHHIFLPFLHKSRYLSTITSLDRSSLDRESAALLFAVIALAAASHDDPYVRARQPQWFTRAKSLCEDLKEKKYPSLRGVQASLCICVLAWTTGNYHLSWLYIGTSWRQAVTLGLNRIDGEQHKVGKNSESKSELDIEERRRTIWTLFVLDRGMAFPAGWPHAIDDRQFMVNLPLPDSVFQASDDQTTSLNSSVPFSRNLRKMTMAKPEDGTCTLYQTILKAYLLLGRATEHIHSFEASSDPEEHFREFQHLDTELSRFTLSLPRTATALRSSSAEDVFQVIWLNAILSTIVILLHHRPETSEPDSSTSFEYCVSAARKMVRLVQDCTKFSVSAAINPLAVSSLYGCARILCFDYHETKNKETKTSIELLLLLFDRIGEVYPTLGAKYRKGVHFELSQTPEDVREMRARGANGMLQKCGYWSGDTPQATFERLTAAFCQ